MRRPGRSRTRSAGQGLWKAWIFSAGRLRTYSWKLGDIGKVFCVCSSCRLEPHPSVPRDVMSGHSGPAKEENGTVAKPSRPLASDGRLGQVGDGEADCARYGPSGAAELCGRKSESLRL